MTRYGLRSRFYGLILVPLMFLAAERSALAQEDDPKSSDSPPTSNSGSPGSSQVAEPKPSDSPVIPDSLPSTTLQEGEMDNPLLIAFIAAGGALIGVVLKDLIFKRFDERRAKRSENHAVYAKYGIPMFTSSVSLMLRLYEALEQPGRGRFLKLAGIPTTKNKYSTFGTYKKLSTLFRLAVLLGWIRACRREFAYLRVADSGALGPIEEAIAQFEHALADGPAVELERLEKLCELWKLPMKDDKTLNSSLGVDLEAVIDEYMQEQNVDEIEALSKDKNSALVQRVGSLMCGALGYQNVHGTVLDETCARAIQIINIKEAWIYRDWQSAIGDLMIRPVESGQRRFETIGFSEFESMCHQGSDEQKKWIARLSALFDGIDLAHRNPYDFRPNQLAEVMKASAVLATKLSEHVKVVQMQKNTKARIAQIRGITSPQQRGDIVND